MSTNKLLKIGGPTVTGIGGIVATSSLISKSAEEKPEEKKTKSLTDEDPLIEDWKDRDESEQEESQEDDSGGSEGDESQEQTQEASGGGGDTGGDNSSDGDSGAASSQGNEQGNSGDTLGVESQEPQSGTEPSGDSAVGEKEGEDSQLGASVSLEMESEPEEAKDDGDTEEGKGITEDGADDAENDHVSGNRYGTVDKGMTLQDLEAAKKLRDNLKELHGKLLSLEKS